MAKAGGYITSYVMCLIALIVNLTLTLTVDPLTDVFFSMILDRGAGHKASKLMQVTFL